MRLVLPPNVTDDQFQRATAALREVVGEQWVLVTDEDRQTYMDPMHIGEPEAHIPCGAVAPAAVAEIQGVLRVANEFRIPLWPVSRGKNLAYGTASPRMSGTMVLDLSRMRRVLEVNEQAAYAVVEPGVSFFDFRDYLAREHGDRLWMSGAAHSWGSVIGNALEHGTGYSPYGMHVDAICGMEVVLANGDIVRTGMGAVEGSREWQVYKYGYGPVWDGVFTQSNLGIVTKMGIWLTPQPQAMAGVSLWLPDEADLARMVDIITPLKIDGTLNATLQYRNGIRQVMSATMAASGMRDTVYRGDGAMPPEFVRSELARLGRGYWETFFVLYDRPAGLDLRLQVIREAFAGIPGFRMQVNRWTRGEPKQPWMRQDVGLAPLQSVDWRGGPGGHTDFAPVIAPVGSRVEAVYRLVADRFYENGLDCYCGIYALGTRSLVMIADTHYNRNDAEMTERARHIHRSLMQDGARMGLGVYRAHLSFMDDGMAMYNFNDHALRRLNETVKAALDPNGIIAPGKQGVWPAQYAAYKDR